MILTERNYRYLHEVIYITCFVQLTSIISRKYWWIYAVIPAFAVYKGGVLMGFSLKVVS
ncbi:putative SRP-independent targeting protein 2/TMEM208 [Helianthus anomalus]